MRIEQRENEIAALRQHFSETAQGRGQVLLVSGPGATGKSELLTYLGEHATDEGAIVLTAACSRTESELPLAVLGQLFRSSALPELMVNRVERILGHQLGDPIPMGRDAEAYTSGYAEITHHLFMVLYEMAQQRPVVLTVDDIQFADAVSLRALVYFQRRLRSLAVLLAVTEWQMGRPTQPLLRAELTRSHRCTRLRLNPLSEEGVASMLRAELGQSGEDYAHDYWSASGGNPMLLRALIEDRLDAGPTEQRVVIGENLRHSLTTSLLCWPSELLEVLRGIALLGEASSAHALAKLLDLGATTVEQVMAALEAVGLLEDGVFRHPGIRDAVLAEEITERCADVRQRAAELLHRQGVAASEVAGQLLAAGEPPKQQWAVEVLVAAARHALTMNQVSRAIECFELALRGCAEEGRRAEVTAMLARAQWLCNPSAAASLVGQLRTAFDSGHLNRSDSITLTRALLWHGEAEEGARVLDAAVREGETEPSTDFDFTTEWLRFAHPAVLPAVGQPVSGSGEQPKQRRGVTLAEMMMGCRSEDVVAEAEQLLEASSLADTAIESVLSTLFTLIFNGKTDRAAQWCETLSEMAEECGASVWLAILADVQAHLALKRGDFARSEQYARQALTEISTSSWGVVVGSPLSHLLLALTGRNKLDEAEGLVKQVMPVGIERTQYWPMFLRARGNFHVMAGRRQAARADFEACGELLREWSFDCSAFLPWRTDLAQVHLLNGQHGKARQLATEEMSRPGGSEPRSRGVALRILGLSYDNPSRGLPALEESAVLLHEAGAQLELMLTLAELSKMHQAVEDIANARLLVRRARQLAKACDAEAICSRIIASACGEGISSYEENQQQESLERPAILSEAERRVASLASRGHTNREISKKLFVTVSTVEQHLTRVYRKLNVNSRADLATELPLAIVEKAV